LHAEVDGIRASGEGVQCRLQGSGGEGKLNHGSASIVIPALAGSHRVSFPSKDRRTSG
jgi:hypothetical protein